MNKITICINQQKMKKRYEYNDNDDYTKTLIKEVIKNGFKCDLCL